MTTTNENAKTVDVIVDDGVAKEVNTEETKQEEAKEEKENKDMKEETKQEETKEETKKEETKKEDKKENKDMKKKMSTKKKVFIGLGVTTLVAAAGAVIYNCMKKSDDTADSNDGGCTVTFF